MRLPWSASGTMELYFGDLKTAEIGAFAAKIKKIKKFWIVFTGVCGKSTRDKK